jgi:hypothetical protein
MNIEMDNSALIDELIKKQTDLFKMYYQEGTPDLDEIKKILGDSQSKGGAKKSRRRTRRKNTGSRSHKRS